MKTQGQFACDLWRDCGVAAAACLSTRQEGHYLKDLYVRLVSIIFEGTRLVVFKRTPTGNQLFWGFPKTDIPT